MMLRIAFISTSEDWRALRQMLVRWVAELSLVDGHRYCDQSRSLTSATRVIPTMTSGIPLAPSRTNLVPELLRELTLTAAAAALRQGSTS
jgi:hypothetical protein